MHTGRMSHSQRRPLVGILLSHFTFEKPKHIVYPIVVFFHVIGFEER